MITNRQGGSVESNDKTTNDAENWTIEQVVSFLERNGLNQYIGTFSSNEIDGSTLLCLDREALGVAPLDRARILGKIKKLTKKRVVQHNPFSVE